MSVPWHTQETTENINGSYGLMDSSVDEASNSEAILDQAI